MSALATVWWVGCGHDHFWAPLGPSDPLPFVILFQPHPWSREKGNIQSSKPGLFWLFSSKQSAGHRGKRNLEFPSKTHAKLKDFMYFPNFLLLRWCLLSLHFHKFPCLRKKPEFLLVFFGFFFAGNFPVKGRKKGKMTHIWPMFYNGIGWISDCYLADRCSRSLKFLWGDLIGSGGRVSRVEREGR